MKKCSKCGEEKELTEFHKDKSRSLGVVPACKSCHAQYHKKRYADIEVVKKSQENNRQYKQENKAKVTEINRLRSAERKKTDPIYKLKKYMRSRIYSAFKNQSLEKHSKTKDMLGCNFELLHLHLFNSALRNYGFYLYDEKYQIDHIIPVSSAKNEEEMVKLNHYSNLQWLTPTDNMKKSNKMPD